MSYKENVKNFFIKFKRLIVASSICLLAIAIMGIVAANTAGGSTLKEMQNGQTSAPTSISFIMPVKDGVVIKDFSNTALKYNATLKQWEAHKAIDIKGADDADVLTVASGEVVAVESNYLLGNVVTIKHSSSLQTVYASLAEDIKVKVGDKVKKGDIIGKVSTSAKGESKDGNHLHFEVLVDNIKVDPNLYLDTGNK